MTISRNDSPDNERSAASSFVERASARLAAVRNGILIHDQELDSGTDLRVCLGSLDLFSSDAAAADRSDLIGPIDSCRSEIRALLAGDAPPTAAGRALDALAATEKALLSAPLSDEFLVDVSDFVDSSFGTLDIAGPRGDTSEDLTDFEVDEETLDIFRSEASDLLNKIGINIIKLRLDPDDREALWEVRRNAHTFKGAAGIVGLKGASELAHRVEDLLDKMVEINSGADTYIVKLLANAARRLEIVSLGTEFTEECEPIEALHIQFEGAIAVISADDATVRAGAFEGPIPAVHVPYSVRKESKQNPGPIVRVSLDRLDDLISLTRTLAESRSLLEDELASIGSRGPGADGLCGMRPLLEAQGRLTEEIGLKLAGIRMVRFGTLETRLGRAVHVTCEEENKNARLSIKNGDCEVDTQVLDALVEPLLHLLKNAIVHGIEDAATRRLIGKPEKGQVSVEVFAHASHITIKVSDDGGGISAARLKQKAIDQAVISNEKAERMTAPEAFVLIFERGLTTADRLNLNAGRGIGMSIVKQSIESHGGEIRIESEPQVGTTFTVVMPDAIPRVETAAMARETAAHLDVAKQALVLVVDDSATVRRQTAALVESTGHRAITAENGAEAIELLLSNVLRPDLILSDVEMPVMDGWELLECIRSSNELASIPVVMVTSLVAIEYVKKAFLLGACDYKVKPLTGPDVLSLITAALTSAKTTEPAVCSA